MANIWAKPKCQSPWLCDGIDEEMWSDWSSFLEQRRLCPEVLRVLLLSTGMCRTGSEIEAIKMLLT